MGDSILLNTIRRVRGRWKLALVLRGATICVAALLLLIAFSAVGFERFGFDAGTIVAFRWAVGLATLAVVGATVIRPAVRRVSDERVALYIEEHEPALQSVLISAIEAPAASTGLTRALVERAAARCKDIEFGSRIEHQRLQRHSVALATTVVAALVIVAAGPAPMRTAARALLLPTPAAEAAAVMRIAVEPGHATIARGSDFAVNANLHAFAAAEAFVVMRAADGEWRRWSMSPGQKPGAFEAVLFDVATTTDYYIEAGTVRSPTFRINVVDAPFVKALTLEYQFPAYTGMAPRRVEDGGDIVAPKGTLVRISAETSAPVQDGRLQLDDARTIRMQPNANGLQASLRVLRDGLYHIELPGVDGAFTSASAQYAITAIADQPPRVIVDKPGRDIKVNAVDEIFVSAHATDDYGVTRLELSYSVNGGAAQTLVLPTPSTRTPEVSGAHTFYLEELSLKPGDFVSYFLRATDNNAIDGAQSATTDIYFIQIKPFSREYRAAEQAGMPGQGGGEEDPGALSEQQRQIIAATFNVSRDRATYTPQGYAEAITTIELSQRKLREQVATLLQRMQQRGVAAMDSTFAQIAQLLPVAAREMAAAEERLQQRAPDEALSPEQRALQQLLRAEALYREVQVQMQQQQQAGGGGGTPPEDLADLFDLERDELRNQYETVQRSQQEQAQRTVDETLERLRELAQRQQQEAERQRQAAGQQQQQQGAGGTGSAQRRLADEAEQAARQLERLAREQNNGEMSEAARRLQEAADAMRRASAQRDGRGLADANAARERLEDARRRLQQNQRESLQQKVDAARQRAEQLREQQRNIARDATSGNTGDAQQQRRLNEQKDQLGSGVAELENRLDRLSAEARSANRNAARELQAAADAIRESRLRERIRATQGNSQLRSQEFNRQQEEQIGKDLDRVAQELAEASAAASGQTAESQSREAAERARRLAQGMESMRERARSAQEAQQGQQGQQGRQGQQGQEGQQGQQGQEAGQNSQSAQESPNGSSTARGQSRSGGTEGARRQLQSEARARAGELQELRRQLQQQGVDAGALEGALDALRRLQSDAPYNDPEEVDRLLAAVARSLANFEFDLRKSTEGAEAEKLYLSSEGQVPAQFKKAVEEYYRALARNRR